LHDFQGGELDIDHPEENNVKVSNINKQAISNSRLSSNYINHIFFTSYMQKNDTAIQFNFTDDES